MNARTVWFVLFSMSVFLLFYGRFNDLMRAVSHRDYYSHIILVPLVSAWLLYMKKEAIATHQEYSLKTGGALIIAGLICYAVLTRYENSVTAHEVLNLMSLSVITAWLGGFILSYGLKSLKTAFIPLSFLAFMIPVPAAVIERLIYVLLTGSVEVTEGLFKLIGMPYSRDGFVFYLPTLSIEVAKQCSGIHSTIALVITGALVAYLFLDKGWKRAVLVASVLPITIFKNGLRIVVLSVIGVYCDEQVLVDGWLHRSGGILFFVIALIFMGAVLWILRKKERVDSSDCVASV